MKVKIMQKGVSSENGAVERRRAGDNLVLERGSSQSDQLYFKLVDCIL